jgi:hypothetical protein
VTAVVALVVAVLALALSGAGVGGAIAWRRTHRRFDALAEQLYVDSRLEQLTVDTLLAMRRAVGQAGGGFRDRTG